MKLIKRLPQLDLFETIVPVEKLMEGERFRIAVDSPNFYIVKEQFFDMNGECKALLNDSRSIYFIPHGRTVFKIL